MQKLGCMHVYTINNTITRDKKNNQQRHQNLKHTHTQEEEEAPFTTTDLMGLILESPGEGDC